ncbi:MAG: hypothetical protein ABF755_00945 [Oenococcus oeni]
MSIDKNVYKILNEFYESKTPIKFEKPIKDNDFNFLLRQQYIEQNYHLDPKDPWQKRIYSDFYSITDKGKTLLIERLDPEMLSRKEGNKSRFISWIAIIISSIALIKSFF